MPRDQAAADPPAECDVLISADWVVTLDDEQTVLEPGIVAIERDKIVWIGRQEGTQPIKAATRIERPGCAILPGLINAHTHLFQTLIRGLGDDLGLFGWIRHVVWPFVEMMSEEDLFVASLAGAIEAARSGTTCLLENHYALTDLQSTLKVRDAVEQIGIRAVIARGVVGPRTRAADEVQLPNTLFRFSADEELEIMEECLRTPSSTGLVTFWPSPLMLSFVDPVLAAKAIRLGRQFGTGWHAHCAEVEVDAQIFRSVNGVAPVEWLASEELLGADATLAHGIWLSDLEIALLGEQGGTVVYNPVSNGFCGMGVLPLRKLLAADVNVALGSDGPGTNNTVDMFEVLKVAVLTQKAAKADPEATTASEVLRLGFQGGAHCVRMQDKIGQIATGRLADLIAVDLSGVHTTPVHWLPSTIVYSARGSDVTLTMVGGKVIFDGREVVGVDERSVLEELRDRAFKKAAQLGAEVTHRRPTNSRHRH